MEESVKERLIAFMKRNKISQGRFEKACGLSRGYINNLRHAPSSDKLQRIFSAFPKMSRTWLLTGEGEMLNRKDELEKEGKMELPLIPLNFYAGALTGVCDSIMDYECEKYIVPIFRGAEFLVRVQGDSMVPKFASGDIVACKRVSLDRLWFQWGKTYVLDTSQGPLIKRIEKSDQEGYVSIHSNNPQYSPFDLPVEEINALALVIGTIRLE